MRLALVPINPVVGDVEGNADRVRAGLHAARQAGADLALFPELCLCGYPPRDLLLAEGFVDACVEASRRIGLRDTTGITAVFGTPMPIDGARGAIANALVVYRDNVFIDRYAKRLLPTYDVFDEDRYFEPGRSPCVVPVPTAGGETVPVGLAICEDLWRGDDAGFSSRYRGLPDPATELVAAGARLILSPSASPFVLFKGERHRGILRSTAARHGVHVASLNQLGANDELVFDGHTLVYGPGGNLLAAGPCFEERPLVVDLSFRADEAAAGIRASVRDEFLERPPEARLCAALVTGIRDYLRKTGFREALLGVSGGIDSAVTAALAATALGPERVLGVAMPGPYSSSHALEDARDLCQRLGMRFLVVPIADAFEGFVECLRPAMQGMGQPPIGNITPDVAEENLQSRIRGTVLMALSNRTGALLLTTGNKSELAVGYCTLYGDMNGGLAVLSDVSKHWVYRLARWMNACHAHIGLARPPIPERSISKPPSAELRPNQKDTDTLPDYDTVDAVVERYVERHQAPSRIARETGIDEAVVRRLARMVDAAEFKRKQAAVGLKVTTVAFGSGRRWPIAQGWGGG